MTVGEHRKVTGFSGNEIFCLHRLGYEPGQLCLGNDVISLGVLRGLGADLSSLGGGEVTEVTRLVHNGRENAFRRLLEEAGRYGGVGLAGVSFDLINHGNHLEFIATGSTVRSLGVESGAPMFSSAANGQELYCQKDCHFDPVSFVFGNVAYSIGIGGNILGALRGLKRGEIQEYTALFDRTRHLSLARIKDEARRVGANAVIGIATSIMPLHGTQEMVMMGTASRHPALAEYSADPVTSDMTSQELWNMVNIGYLPVGLVMGVSVYSLGLTGGIMSYVQSLLGGQVSGLTELLYEAREKALERIQRDAEQYAADEIVGVKTNIYDLGGGLMEVMVIGTAIRKFDQAGTRTDSLLPQVMIEDRDTFIHSQRETIHLREGGKASVRQTLGGPLSIVATIITIGFVAYHYLESLSSVFH